jgi:hypothetical protein
MLSMGHWIDFEIHVYGRAVAEVGVFGSNGWLAKHRLGDDIELNTAKRESPERNLGRHHEKEGWTGDSAN